MRSFMSSRKLATAIVFSALVFGNSPAIAEDVGTGVTGPTTQSFSHLRARDRFVLEDVGTGNATPSTQEDVGTGTTTPTTQATNSIASGWMLLLRYFTFYRF